MKNLREKNQMGSNDYEGVEMGNDNKPLWAKLAMGYYDDPKFNRVSPLAELLYVRAISFAKRDNTGVVSKGAVMRLCADLGDTENLSQELVDAELWLSNEDGFYIENWCEWQEHQVKIDARREAGRKSAHKRWGSDGSPNGLPNGSAMGNPMQEREKERETEINTHAHQPKADGEFDVFWLSYPRKVGKEAARKAWKATARKRPDFDSVLEALEQAKGVWAKGDPRFIPHPATWLNQGRWADEATVAPVLGEDEAEARRRATEARLAAREAGVAPPAEFRAFTARVRRQGD